jgi:hypothetical protein
VLPARVVQSEGQVVRLALEDTGTAPARELHALAFVAAWDSLGS